LQQLTAGLQSETVGSVSALGGRMKRIVAGALFLAGFVGFLPVSSAQAQTSSGVRNGQAVTDVSAQRRGGLRRVPVYPRWDWEPDVYPRYNPGPNAVRVCNATYATEYRPSGPVITPRINCSWRRG